MDQRNEFIHSKYFDLLSDELVHIGYVPIEEHLKDNLSWIAQSEND